MLRCTHGACTAPIRETVRRTAPLAAPTHAVGRTLGLKDTEDLALLAGLPAFYLLVLACPLMMLAMMPGMRGGHDSQRQSKSSKLDGSHERIDQP